TMLVQLNNESIWIWLRSKLQPQAQAKQSYGSTNPAAASQSTESEIGAPQFRGAPSSPQMQTTEEPPQLLHPAESRDHSSHAEQTIRLSSFLQTVSPCAWMAETPNARTERRGRPSASALPTDVARPRSLQ